MMIKRLFITLILLSGTAIADKDTVINNLERFFGTIEKEDIMDSPFNGVYEVIVYNPVDSLLVSKDGQYIIQGDVVDLTTRKLLPISDKVKLIKATLINSINDQDQYVKV